jgi:hypothetical protein
MKCSFFCLETNCHSHSHYQRRQVTVTVTSRHSHFDLASSSGSSQSQSWFSEGDCFVATRGRWLVAKGSTLWPPSTARRKACPLQL